MSIVSGRIMLRGNIEKARNFIQTLENEHVYPWLRAEMFSLGNSESPYFYQSPAIALAATYKSVEDNWVDFIQKFEYILTNIDFDTAKIQIETEFFGNFHFFLENKIDKEHFDPREQLIETEKWFFGYGCRHQFGLLEKVSSGELNFPFEFNYPPDFRRVLAVLL